MIKILSKIYEMKIKDNLKLSKKDQEKTIKLGKFKHQNLKVFKRNTNIKIETSFEVL